MDVEEKVVLVTFGERRRDIKFRSSANPEEEMAALLAAVEETFSDVLSDMSSHFVQLSICCDICDICASSPYPLSGSRSGNFNNSVLVVSIARTRNLSFGLPALNLTVVDTNTNIVLSHLVSSADHT